MLGDVDGLKRVNDSLGHPAGDEALLSVAEAALRAVRDVPGAVAARLGGDEYALLLPGVDVGRALAVADAWCGACERGRHGTSLSAGVLVVADGAHAAGRGLRPRGPGAVRGQAGPHRRAGPRPDVGPGRTPWRRSRV